LYLITQRSFEMLIPYNKCVRLNLEMTETPVALLVKFQLFVAYFTSFWRYRPI